VLTAIESSRRPTVQYTMCCWRLAFDPFDPGEISPSSTIFRRSFTDRSAIAAATSSRLVIAFSSTNVGTAFFTAFAGTFSDGFDSCRATNSSAWSFNVRRIATDDVRGVVHRPHMFRHPREKGAAVYVY